MTSAIWGNSLYVVVEGPNWDDAQLNAESLGGDLVQSIVRRKIVLLPRNSRKQSIFTMGTPIRGTLISIRTSG